MNIRPSTRQARWRAVLLLAAVGALVVAGVAGAANSAAFADRPGDVKLAADITQLDVSNDDAGTVTIRLTFGDGGIPPGLPGEALGVALDLDQNPDSGSVYYGTEVAFALSFALDGGNTLTFGRVAGDGFSPAPPPASLHGTMSGDNLTFSVNAADLGLAANGGFNIVALSGTSVTDDGDLAPDIRTFNYQLVAGTPKPPLSADRRAPVDHAYASRGVHGKVAELVYAAQDGRGVTADTIRVYRGSRVLKTIRISLGDASPFASYVARWRAPRQIHGRLRFCVRSRDAAGNRSNESCARLVIT